MEAPIDQQRRLSWQTISHATIQKYLPDFARAVAEIAPRDEPDGTIVLHQDAFAAGYDDDEYTLLGMAVKYAGLSGISVTVIGKSHETF